MYFIEVKIAKVNDFKESYIIQTYKSHNHMHSDFTKFELTS